MWAVQGTQLDIAPVLHCVVQYVQQGGMQEANPQDWSNVLWALAEMGWQPISAAAGRVWGRQKAACPTCAGTR